MRLGAFLGVCAVLSLGAGCGGERGPEDLSGTGATYEVFTLDLVDLSEGDRVLPGQALRYDVHYQGDLARNLRFTAHLTHEASGAVATVSWSEAPEDTARIDFRRLWYLRDELLEKSGPIRVQLEAELTATRTGSRPWSVRSESVFVDLRPSLEHLELHLPTAQRPVPYGTPMEVELTGQDLWRDAEVTVHDADSGAAVEGLSQVVPFDGSQSVSRIPWTLSSPALEHLGVHRLQVVARYGDLELRTQVLELEVTHTLDTVTVLLRDAQGNLAPPSSAFPRLQDVTGVGLRITGQKLQGHDVRINDGFPLPAWGDSLDVVLVTPEPDDFEDGKGRHTYAFVVRAGGMERRAEVTLQRWGITRCGWRTPEGEPLPEGQALDRGTQVQLHAELWGFPDTTTQLLFFKSPQARFTVWERDPGGQETPEEIDFTQNNDDEGDAFDADVKDGVTHALWTTVYEDEFDLLDLHTNAAEYSFRVEVEDQRCASGEIRVW